MIDAAAVAYVIATYFGAWALGFGVGKSVAWTRAIRSAV